MDLMQQPPPLYQKTQKISASSSLDAPNPKIYTKGEIFYKFKKKLIWLPFSHNYFFKQRRKYPPNVAKETV